MLSRTIMIAVAAGALSVTPMLAQQPKPVQTVASVSPDTTHVTKHAHRRTTKARSSNAAIPASPSVKSEHKTTPVKHKSGKRSTTKSKRTTADSTKKP